MTISATFGKYIPIAHSNTLYMRPACDGLVKPTHYIVDFIVGGTFSFKNEGNFTQELLSLSGPRNSFITRTFHSHMS